MKAINVYIGDMVHDIRENNKTTQIELAVEMNLSRASIVNIEAGRQAVSLDLLFRLSVYFNRPIADFVPEQKWYIEHKDKSIRRVTTYIIED